MTLNSKIRTCLWFPGNGEEAAEFYVSLIPGSAITSTYKSDPDQPPIVIDFTLGNNDFMIINGGNEFEHSPAVSISVSTDDQKETDMLWAALTANGGKESRCGWLIDRYGISWQIVPRVWTQLFVVLRFCVASIVSRSTSRSKGNCVPACHSGLRPAGIP